MRKTLIAGVIAGLAVTAVGIAVAAIPTGNTIEACYDVKTGAVRVFDPENGIAGCSQKEQRLAWNVQGPQGEPGQRGEQGLQGEQGAPGDQGPPGTFSGTFTSQNGHYSISVTDTGIVLSGGGGSVEISDTGVTVEGDDTLTLRGDTDVNVISNGDVSVRAGGTVELEGTAGVDIKSSGDVTIKGSKINQN